MVLSKMARVLFYNDCAAKVKRLKLRQRTTICIQDQSCHGHQFVPKSNSDKTTDHFQQSSHTPITVDSVHSDNGETYCQQHTEGVRSELGVSSLQTESFCDLRFIT